MACTRWLALSAAVLILFGCGGGDRTESGEQATAEGVVVRVDDQIPADGPLTLYVTTDTGEEVVLRFGSMFTDPPPTEERTRLYEVVREVRAGDRVRGSGTRGAEGIELTDLVVLVRAAPPADTSGADTLGMPADTLGP